MPQATDEMRDLMGRWFDDPIGSFGPLVFLYRRGWSDRGGWLTPPVPSYKPSEYEFTCIEFLCDEWDYGYKGTPNDT